MSELSHNISNKMLEKRRSINSFQKESIINKLLGSSFNCNCGKLHSIPTKYFFYSNSAFREISNVLENFATGKSVCILADENTYLAAANEVEKILKNYNWNISTIIVQGIKNSKPVCDDNTFNKLNLKIKKADIFLAVGSGVINDLTKWLAFEHNKNYAVAPTAASMNGYTSANVAPTIKGVKQLVRARPPIAVFVNPEVIINSPYELTAAGLGDLIAKPISTTDWILNHELFNEHFCEYCSSLINDIEPYYFKHSENLVARKPKAINAIIEALMLTGFAMTMIGVSAPASGGEHLFSHTLDMMSSIDGIAHDLHGRQVGIGTIIAAKLYEKIFDINIPKTYDMPKYIDKKFWGNISNAIDEQYIAKQEKLLILKNKLSSIEYFNNLKNLLKQKIRPANDIFNCLKNADAAYSIKNINCSYERAVNALLHSHEIRRRPTVIDLAWTLGILPDAAEDIISELCLN